MEALLAPESIARYIDPAIIPSLANLTDREKTHRIMAHLSANPALPDDIRRACAQVTQGPLFDHMYAMADPAIAPTQPTRADTVNPMCCVCDDAPKCVLFLPCKHVCACEACHARLQACPLCRVAIVSRHKVFI